MTIDAVGSSAEKPEGLDLVAVMDQLDSQRLDLFGQAEAYYHRPRKSNLDTFVQATGSYATLFSRSVRNILTEPDTPAKAKAGVVTTLLINEESDRVNFLNELTKSDTFVLPESFANREDLIKNIQDLLEQDIDQASDTLVENFLRRFEFDLNELNEKVEKTFYGRVIECKETLVPHVLEIGKIAAGVALGIWFSQRRKR